MRAVVQRVRQAEVCVGNEQVGAIGRGLLVLVGVHREDTELDVEWLSRKLLRLRVFGDEAGKMNLALPDVGGEVLLVSQFTLCGDVDRGTRPSFASAMAPEPARVLFERLVDRVGEAVPIATGRFGAHMEIRLVNDGPVTLWLSTEGRR